MKKTSLFLFVILFVLCNTLAVSARVPAVSDLWAEAAVLMDADTGQVLYEKNPHTRKHPASITKIMTGLLIAEQLDAGETVVASETAVNLPAWGSSAYLQAGEHLTVEQAMYAMMLPSGNDAANVLAEAAGGSLDIFAQMMTNRARGLGAKNTTFTNAHGLPQRGHLTTAYDMALITREAISVPGFLNYIGTDSYPMAATDKNTARVFTNTHKMLLPGYAQYTETVIGGKTGYTTPSGYTLVTVARQEGRTLICVVLDSDSYYTDTQILLDFGFREFTPFTYTFQEDSAPSSVPVWDGDWQAGRAYLSQPDSASILLHESIDADELSASYQLPEHPDIQDDIEGRVDILLSDEKQAGLPDTLLSIPLQVESVVAFAPPETEAVETHTVDAEPSVETAAPQQPQGRFSIPRFCIFATGLTALLVGVVYVVKRRVL